MSADDLVRRALAVQDQIGWTDTSDTSEMGQGLLELARVVVELSRQAADRPEPSATRTGPRPASPEASPDA